MSFGQMRDCVRLITVYYVTSSLDRVQNCTSRFSSRRGRLGLLDFDRTVFLLCGWAFVFMLLHII